MSSAFVGNKSLPIKPGDLVRTPSGATGTVESVNPDGSRELRLLNGDRLALKPAHLRVVRSAPVLPWPKRTP